MKQTPTIEILKDGRKLYGLFLEQAPDAPEHQKGLAGLYKFIGVPSSKLRGIEARTIPETSWLDHAVKLKDIQLSEKFLAPLPPPGQRAAKPKTMKSNVIVLSLGIDTAAKSQALSYGKRQDPETEVAGAWSDVGFSVTAYSDDGKALFPRLQKALMDGDLAMWIGQHPKSDKRGLYVVIVSKMPEYMKARLTSEDARAADLARDAKETAIERRLRRAAQKFSVKNKTLAKALETCALTPLRAGDVENSKRTLSTKHPLVFELKAPKPYASGVFTVEELEQWMDGRGPIVPA